MSLCTKNNKSWVKKARGTLKTKDWKNTQESYWVTKTTTSAAGKVYTNIVPWSKLHKKHYNVQQDMVAYLSKFFTGFQ